MSEETQTASEMVLRPVGIVRSEIKEPILKPDSDDPELQREFVDARKKVRKMRDKVAELVIDEELEGILDGIEDFSHILVLFWPHLIPDEKRSSLVRVHPMGRKEFPLVGIFSTCSPVRPNPVLATVVRLVERNGNLLKVTGLDAVDGSPIIDIKPYAPGFYPSEGMRTPEWMEQIQKEFS
ncbi:tRNA (N6-threonylcarbamoyladenosine(37)-N6)-methyltransferase TrmO [Desulfobacterales bacterium HSG2]|nr:tRNA (N6-threonylcarbamoyladenosine(37)-N6)-methyltransferase TrmO [Desulfobacterales bacterium HSG2]